jgi:hypothetical protein
MMLAPPLELQLGQRMGEGGLNQGNFFGRYFLFQTGFGARAGVFCLVLIDRCLVRGKNGQDGNTLGCYFGATARDE